MIQGYSKTAQMGTRWPNGKIFYLILIDPNVHPKICDIISLAIVKWNQWNGPHCLFVMADETTPYCVNFLIDGSRAFKTHVGNWKSIEQMIIIPPQHANSQALTVACVLHEMMHTAGFRHESITDPSLVNQNGLPLGKIDPFSIMHLGHVVIAA